MYRFQARLDPLQIPLPWQGGKAPRMKPGLTNFRNRVPLFSFLQPPVAELVLVNHPSDPSGRARTDPFAPGWHFDLGTPVCLLSIPDQVARVVQDRRPNPHPSRSNQAIPAPFRPRPLTTDHCRYTVGPFRPSLVRGDTPRNAPRSYATMRARPQLMRQRPEVMPPCLRDPSPSPTRRGLDAAVCAHRQPIARPTGAYQSLPFLATGYWPLQSRKSALAVPCESLRNVLYCKVEPVQNRAGPERAAFTYQSAHHTQAAPHVDPL